MSRTRKRKPFPKSIDEFIMDGWEDQIRYRINVFCLKDILNSPDDLVQDIIVALIETGYISRYSEEKGPFSTYLYGFVDNFLKKKYNKENTRNGRKIVNSASIETTSGDRESEFDGSTVYLDLLPNGNAEEEFDINILLEEIREELKKYKSNSSVIYEGVELQRDALTVFNLILDDYSVIEISKMLGTSRQYVYHLIKKIRDLDTFKELKCGGTF